MMFEVDTTSPFGSTLALNLLEKAPDVSGVHVYFAIISRARLSGLGNVSFRPGVLFLRCNGN
jgi:hypothetical protein